ncbi:RNase H domain-containing protein [Trichonephila clavipes]|nr:RNase H domain-containing protein [Trichonephila clavipes]
MPGDLVSCTCSKVSKLLKASFALLGASYKVIQLILHWVTPQRIVFWKKADHKVLPHPSCRKPITQECKTVCFTDGSTLNERVGLACVIYEEGVKNATFQHRLRDECSVFQAELLCINLVVKLIQDSLRQGGTLNFLICTDSLSSLQCLLSVNSTEKLVVEVQSIIYYLDCDITFLMFGAIVEDVNLCQDVNLLMSMSLYHWKHVA